MKANVKFNGDEAIINGVKYRRDKTLQRFQPECGEEYWFVEYGIIRALRWGGDYIDIWLYSQHNVFRTQKEAESLLTYIEALHRVRDAINKANDGWEPDFTCYTLADAPMGYDVSCNIARSCSSGGSQKFHIDRTADTQYASVIPICRTGDIAEHIIETYEDDLRIIFGS